MRSVDVSPLELAAESLVDLLWLNTESFVPAWGVLDAVSLDNSPYGFGAVQATIANSRASDRRLSASLSCCMDWTSLQLRALVCLVDVSLAVPDSVSLLPSVTPLAARAAAFCV